MRAQARTDQANLPIGNGSRRTGERRTEKPQPEGEPEVPASGLSLATTVARCAELELSVLTGYEVESVTGIQRDEHGWHVTIDVVELEKVPRTTDVMGTYLVDIDNQGELSGYWRVRRFVRGRADPEVGR
ncbi:MAG: gas vesicle protein [Polyangiaceae bacterium]|nr:gas vesicle protein [Polyangiaceae bacterium]